MENEKRPGQAELEYLSMYINDKLKKEDPSVQMALTERLNACFIGLVKALGLDALPPDAE